MRARAVLVIAAVLLLGGASGQASAATPRPPALRLIAASPKGRRSRSGRRHDRAAVLRAAGAADRARRAQAVAIDPRNVVAAEPDDDQLHPDRRVPAGHRRACHGPQGACRRPTAPTLRRLPRPPSRSRTGRMSGWRSCSRSSGSCPFISAPRASAAPGEHRRAATRDLPTAGGAAGVRRRLADAAHRAVEQRPLHRAEGRGHGVRIPARARDGRRRERGPVAGAAERPRPPAVQSGRLQLRAGHREQPGVAHPLPQRARRPAHPRQHRHRRRGHRHRHVPGVRAAAQPDHAGHEPGRVALRGLRAVGGLFQRRRRRPLHAAGVVRVAAEPRLHRAALRRRRAGLGLFDLRDARHGLSSYRLLGRACARSRSKTAT